MEVRHNQGMRKGLGSTRGTSGRASVVEALLHRFSTPTLAYSPLHTSLLLALPSLHSRKN